MPPFVNHTLSVNYELNIVLFVKFTDTFATSAIRYIQFGPSSEVRPSKPLTILPLTANRFGIPLPVGSAYVQSRLPRPTPSEKPDTFLQVTTQTPGRASDS